MTQISKYSKHAAQKAAAERAFLEICSGSKCRDATNNILHAINGGGVTTCDFLKTLWSHHIDVYGNRVTGNKDYIAKRATGLL